MIKPIHNFFPSADTACNFISNNGRGYLDVVSHDFHSITIEGWALISGECVENKIPRTIYICHDKKIIGTCIPNLDRDDVIKCLSIDNKYIKCGFISKFECDDALGMCDTLSIYFDDENGGLVPLPNPYGCAHSESPLQPLNDTPQSVQIEKNNAMIKPIFNFRQENSTKCSHISNAGKGYLDIVRVENHTVTIEGWALVDNDGTKHAIPKTLYICYDKQIIGTCSPNFERYDVVNNLIKI